MSFAWRILPRQDGPAQNEALLTDNLTVQCQLGPRKAFHKTRFCLLYLPPPGDFSLAYSGKRAFSMVRLFLLLLEYTRCALVGTGLHSSTVEASTDSEEWEEDRAKNTHHLIGRK
uniref:Uncharacterized protein n=1 Tax=Mesocestoides corti TaxID=53468 RepID=A0A5K3EKZ1_MESCO